MSSANRLRISVAKEGTFLGSLGTWKTIRQSSQSLKPNYRTIQSDTMRSDGNIQDIIRVATDASGGIPFNFHLGGTSSGLYDLIEAAMRTTAVVQASVTDAAISLGGTSISSASAAFTTGTVWVAGDTIWLSGTNGGWFTIQSITSATVIEVLPSPSVWAANDTGLTLKRGARMTNGTTLTTFAVEQAFLDAAQYIKYTGCGVNQFGLTIEDEQLMKANMAFLGGAITNDSSPYASSPTAAPTSDEMSNKVNVPIIKIDGTSISVKKVGFTIDNGLMLETVVASQAAIGMNLGSFVMTGELQFFLNAASMAFFTKLVAGTEFRLLFVAADPGNTTSIGKGWSFSIPAAKFTDADVSTQGLNTSQMISMPWQAKLHSTEAIQARVQIFT